MKKIILFFTFILIFLPNKVFAYDMNIYVNDKKIELDNFLYNDRTFVNVNDFCSLSNLCTLSNTDNKKIIKISQKINSGNDFEYSYELYHEIGTKSYDSRVIIGNDTIGFSQDNIDVTSCPTGAKIKCDDNNIYVPLRFISQALGNVVGWEGNNIYITDNLYKLFNEKYNVYLTHKIYYKDETIKDNIVKKENNIYKIPRDYSSYVYVTNKSDVVVPAEKEFAFFDKKIPKEVKDDGVFEIVKEEKSILKTAGIVGGKSSIAQIIMFKQDEYSSSGTYPIVIPNYYEIIDKIKVKKQEYIYISPSLQIDNKYICENTNEMAEMKKLADLVEEKLIVKDWITVYRAPYIEGGQYAFRESSKYGKKFYDHLTLYLSLHSNALGVKNTYRRGVSSVNNPNYSVKSVMYSEMLKNAIIDIHPNKADDGSIMKEVNENSPEYAKTAAYLEVGYHDNVEDCKWLIDNKTKDDMATAIANTLINYWENNNE